MAESIESWSNWPKVIENLHYLEFETIKDFLNKQKDRKYIINDGGNIHHLTYEADTNQINIWTKSKGRVYQYQITDDKLYSNGNSNEIKNFFKEIIVKITEKSPLTLEQKLERGRQQRLRKQLIEERSPNPAILVNYINIIDYPWLKKSVRDVLFSNDDINAIRKNDSLEMMKGNLRIIQQFLKRELPNSNIVVTWIYDKQTKNAINDYRKGRISIPDLEKYPKNKGTIEIQFSKNIFWKLVNFIENKGFSVEVKWDKDRKDKQYTFYDKNKNRYALISIKDNEKTPVDQISVWSTIEKRKVTFVIIGNKISIFNIEDDKKAIPTIVNWINEFLKEIDTEEKKIEKKK
jgi:hypothetical protein